MPLMSLYLNLVINQIYGEQIICSNGLGEMELKKLIIEGAWLEKVFF